MSVVQLMSACVRLTKVPTHLTFENLNDVRMVYVCHKLNLASNTFQTTRLHVDFTFVY